MKFIVIASYHQYDWITSTFYILRVTVYLFKKMDLLSLRYQYTATRCQLLEELTRPKQTLIKSKRRSPKIECLLVRFLKKSGHSLYRAAAHGNIEFLKTLLESGVGKVLLH